MKIRFLLTLTAAIIVCGAVAAQATGPTYNPTSLTINMISEREWCVEPFKHFHLKNLTVEARAADGSGMVTAQCSPAELKVGFVGCHDGCCERKKTIACSFPQEVEPAKIIEYSGDECYAVNEENGMSNGCYYVKRTKECEGDTVEVWLLN